MLLSDWLDWVSDWVTDWGRVKSDIGNVREVCEAIIAEYEVVRQEHCNNPCFSLVAVCGSRPHTARWGVGWLGPPDLGWWLPWFACTRDQPGSLHTATAEEKQDQGQKPGRGHPASPWAGHYLGTEVWEYTEEEWVRFQQETITITSNIRVAITSSKLMLLINSQICNFCHYKC